MMLGNLSINEIENRLGIVFPDELKHFMKDTHQLSANNIKKGMWHCFDIPLMINCGDIETAEVITKHLTPFSKDMKEKFQISYN